jgi:hypothetical protein
MSSCAQCSRCSAATATVTASKHSRSTMGLTTRSAAAVAASVSVFFVHGQQHKLHDANPDTALLLLSGCAECSRSSAANATVTALKRSRNTIMT